MKQAQVLLVDCGYVTPWRDALREILATRAHTEIPLRLDVLETTEKDLATRVAQRTPDILVLLVSDEAMPNTGALVQSLRTHYANLPILLAASQCDPSQMYLLLKNGVTDFVMPPFALCDILPRIWRLLEHVQQTASTKYSLKTTLGLQQLVGECPAFLAEIGKIPDVAKCDASVLITGETGTGKELCARALHYLSSRARKPFVPVNCGAIPTELVENELFGHESGAFTGATTSRPGLIEEANGGTLFFDEIDCLPLSAQVKLLRFLQDKEYRPLGSTKSRRGDVRIIAASNTPLDAAVKDGRLRQDLYYRLNIVCLNLPPLRERREDIPLIAQHLLVKYAGEHKKSMVGFSAQAIQKMMQYDWPGNVRELEHLIHRTVVLSAATIVDGADISLPESQVTVQPHSFRSAKAIVTEQFERTYILALLTANHGNITKAAAAANKNRRAFWQLIRKYDINPQSYKSASQPLNG